VNVVPGTFLITVYVGLGINTGGGGPFWFNFGVGTSSDANWDIFKQAHYEYISFGNGPSYPIHSGSFVVQFSGPKPLYLTLLCYGIDSLPTNSIQGYGYMTVVRLF
jgi:hypothetical protein